MRHQWTGKPSRSTMRLLLMYAATPQGRRPGGSRAAVSSDGNRCACCAKKLAVTGEAQGTETAMPERNADCRVEG
jgi:hypothetical protein